MVGDRKTSPMSISMPVACAISRLRFSTLSELPPSSKKLSGNADVLDAEHWFPDRRQAYFQVIARSNMGAPAHRRARGMSMGQSVAPAPAAATALPRSAERLDRRGRGSDMASRSRGSGAPATARSISQYVGIVGHATVHPVGRLHKGPADVFRGAALK